CGGIHPPAIPNRHRRAAFGPRTHRERHHTVASRRHHQCPRRREPVAECRAEYEWPGTEDARPVREAVAEPVRVTESAVATPERVAEGIVERAVVTEAVRIA